jgi:cell division protein FtsB
MKIAARTWVIIGIVALILFLLANGGSRTMFRRYWEMHRLRLELEQLKKENALLRKEAYFLEEDSSYIERIARKELGLVSSGEVEYRFKK